MYVFVYILYQIQCSASFRSAATMQSGDAVNALFRNELMDECVAKVHNGMEDAEANAYMEYFEWCDDVAFERFTALGRKASNEKLEATIGQLSSDVSTGTSKIEDLTESIAAADKAA